MYIWVWCIYTSTYGVGFVLLVLDWKAMLEPWKRNCNNGVPLFLCTYVQKVLFCSLPFSEKMWYGNIVITKNNKKSMEIILIIIVIGLIIYNLPFITAVIFSVFGFIYSLFKNLFKWISNLFDRKIKKQFIKA